MEGMIFLFFIGIIIFAALAIQSENKRVKKQKEELNKAKETYDKNLENLSKESDNNLLRKKCLDSGRYYYSLLRNRTGTTTVDETAINNDLFAATGKRDEI